MIVNRDRQLELVNLALIWALAVSIQLFLCNMISTFICLYVFKVDFLSSYQIIEGLVSILRNRMFWGFCLGVFFSWRTLLLGGQIELETALCFTGVIGGLLGFLPLMIGNGKPNWVIPIFFMECAPLCALFWRLLHLGNLRFEKWQINRAKKAEALKSDVKAVRAESLPQTTGQGQEVVNKTEEPKKEEKPIEQAPQPSKESLTKPTRKKSRWGFES